MSKQLQLPRPGSVWKQTQLNRHMRVIFSSIKQIVTHDAELADKIKTIVSWAGTADEFFDLFEPGDTAAYPKTANTN